MVDINKIIEILKKYPRGLKAKDIATLIYGADRNSVNQILYANPTIFLCNTNYEWTLLSKPSATTRSDHIISSQAIPKRSEINRIFIDNEVYSKYNNFYVEFNQVINHGNNFIGIYLLGKSNYIIKSSTKHVQCPFCGNIISVRFYDCDRCGRTLHDICENLYMKWNVSGHRIYITAQSVDKYPINERDRKVYEAIRRFIINCLHHSVHTYFKDVIDEVHIDTLLMIYMKSLGMNKVEEEIKEEINTETCNLRKALFNKEISFSEITMKQKFYLEKAYINDVLVDYEACKLYLAYMALFGKTTSIKYIKNMVIFKIYGGLDLSNDTIYKKILISKSDTIVSTEYLNNYHKECDHYCEKIYLKIPLMLSSGDIIVRTLLGTYCDKCKKYFILDTEFKKILCEGKIQAHVSFSESGTNFNGMDLSPESLLRKCGYTVSANSKATKEQRQKLLKAIIENKLYTPAKIVSHFRFLISINNNVASRDMSSAISKWREDIMFLQQNYSKS